MRYASVRRLKLVVEDTQVQIQSRVLQATVCMLLHIFKSNNREMLTCTSLEGAQSNSDFTRTDAPRYSHLVSSSYSYTVRRHRSAVVICYMPPSVQCRTVRQIADEGKGGSDPVGVLTYNFRTLACSN